MKNFKNKSFLKHLIHFIVVQIVMFFIIIFFAGGGHGTGIPAIIFFGPLIMIFKFIIPENILILPFILLFLILFGFFILVWRGLINKKVLINIAISYTLISVLILIYIELRDLDLSPSNNAYLNLKLIAGLISVITSAAFWKIIFDLTTNKTR